MRSGTAGGVVLLRKTWRFGGAIAELAAAVRDGDANAAIEVLHASRGRRGCAGRPRRSGHPVNDVVGAASQVRESARSGDGAAAWPGWNGTACCAPTAPARVVCRIGPAASRIGWPTSTTTSARASGTPGRPVLVMANDYALGLFNGDTGVVVRDRTPPCARCSCAKASLPSYAPRRLGDVQTVHAMTVHRSQGSQFKRVTFVLPEIRFTAVHPRIAVHRTDQGRILCPAGRHGGGTASRRFPGRQPGRVDCGCDWPSNSRRQQDLPQPLTPRPPK